MTQHDLIGAFDVLAEAPEGVTRLRELVLQLAVQGKLVPQNPEDELASVLLERIAAEKARLFREGKYRAPQAEAAVTKGDAPFDLPSGWAWTCTSALGFVNPRYDENDTVVAGFAAMPAIPTDFRGMVEAQPRPWREIKKGFTHFADGDVVVAKITPCFQNQKSCVMEGLPGSVGAGTTELHVISPIRGQVDPKYLLLFYKSPAFIDGGVREFTGTAGQQRVPRDYFASTPLPLPPLAEQHRIVARVDELMSLLDRLEAARSNRERSRSALRDSALAALRDADTPDEVEAAWQRVAERMDDLFTDPADVDPLRQAVLQLAVRGRLVPQDPDEGPANRLLERIAAEKARLVSEGKIRGEKPLPPVSKDQIPFDLPDGWQSCRLQDLCWQITDGSHHTPTYVEDGVPFVSVKDVSSGCLDFSDCKYISPVEHARLALRCKPERNDILLTKIGTTGIAVDVQTDREFSLFVSVALLKHFPAWVSSTFLRHLLNSPLVRVQSAEGTEGVGNKNLVLRKIRAFAIPVPPLAEQHRIVARVDELMGLLDRLEQHLVAKTAAQNAFAAAAVHHLDA